MIEKIPLELGAFEVYFMGIRLFSKLKSGKWPNIDMVAEKCKQVYEAYNVNSGNDLDFNEKESLLDKFEARTSIAGET